MKQINSGDISTKDMLMTYHVIKAIMENNQLNFNTAWNHVRSALARAIVEKLENE